MLHVNRWAVTFVLVLTFIAILFAVPSFLPESVRSRIPSFLPNSAVNLGLDLQGGSYLLLEVDVGGASRERLETLRADIRTELRRQRIGYTGLDVNNGVLNLRITDSARIEDARAALRKFTTPAQAVLGMTANEYDLSESGNEFSIRMASSYGAQFRSQLVSQSIEVVRRRIDELGTREPTIQRQGADRILVQVPGLKDPAQLKSILSQTAKMTFRLVNTSGDIAAALKGRVPPDSDLLYEGGGTGPQGQQQGTPYLVYKRVMVSGDRLTQASAGFDSRNGQPVVNFRFDTRGSTDFGNTTKANVGKPFAIVLDNKVISAPVINEPILGGSGQISGNFTIQTANDLAILLNAGALPADLTVIEERTVGAELGADSVSAGAQASVFGLAAVVAFMVATYGLFGVFAAIALLVNMTLLMAFLALIQATLTLPGIAGIVLTMGMAVDANVLIYERIREELRAGKSVIASIDAGFHRAIATIIDTNATHVLAAAILYAVGTGPVRGFAVTLGLGVITSFFTATMVTRLTVASWLRWRRPKTLAL